MTLAQPGSSVLHFRERQITELIDISGARDTATAVLALAVVAGATYPEAAAVANKACALVVSKMRTAVVTNEELRQELERNDVFANGTGDLRLAEISETIERWKLDGFKVGLTISSPGSPLESQIQSLAGA